MRLFTHIILLSFSISLSMFAAEVAQCPEHISTFLTQYERPFTLVEIKPGTCPFSFSIAKNFDCTCVILEHESYESLLVHCQQEMPEQVVLLARSMGWPGYRTLGECEHFDVVLIRHPHDHFVAEFEPNWSTLLQLGDYTFIEIPADQQEYAQQLCNYLQKHAITYTQAQTDCGICLLVEQHKTMLSRKVWQAGVNQKNMYSIASTFTKKELVHLLKKKPAEWIAGINLATFVTLNGLYPNKEWIYEKVSQFKTARHNDFWIGNMIIQGRDIKLIDFGDLRRNANFKKQFDKTLRSIKTLRTVPW